MTMPKNYYCSGCYDNLQKIKILENRITFLEQNMTPKIHTTRRSRSRSKRKFRSQTPVPPQVDKAPQSAPNKTKKETLKSVTRKMEQLHVSKLPEYIPPSRSSHNTQLNPSAPAYYPSSSQSGYSYDPTGGTSGYCDSPDVYE
uniref:ORFX n=1 Tax=Berant virus TaxID=1888315 RepID=A0A1B2RVR2_9VIRU|nr:ORFX [Berant virus]